MQIFRNIYALGFLNLFSTFFLQFILFFSNLYMAKVLTLEEYGALGLIRYILLYAPLYAFGIPQALIYKVPKYIEINKDISVYYSTVYIFIVFFSILYLPIFFLFYYLNLRLNNVCLGIGWILLALSILAQGLYGFTIFYLRSFMYYLELSFSKILFGIFYVFLIFILITKYHLIGYMIAYIMANSVVFLIFFKKFEFNLNFSYFNLHKNLKRIKKLIKKGFIIRLNTLIWSLFISIDLWIVSSLIGSIEAGLYAFLSLVNNAFDALLGVFRELLVPKFVAKFAKLNKNKKTLKEVIVSFNYSFFVLSLISKGLVVFTFVILILFFLEKYIYITKIIPLFLLGSIIGSLRFLSGDVLILYNKQKIVLFFNILILTLVISLDFIFAIYLKSIFYIALSTSLGIALLGLIQVIYLYKLIKVEIIKIASICFLLLVAFFYMFLDYIFILSYSYYYLLALNFILSLTFSYVFWRIIKKIRLKIKDV